MPVRSPKKVGALPVGDDGRLKQTNEISAVIPLLEQLDPGSIAGKTITGDALLTQRKLAAYLIDRHQAHYLFTVKGNHPGMLAALKMGFADRGLPAFREADNLAHGRIESRAIWTHCALNGYLIEEPQSLGDRKPLPLGARLELGRRPQHHPHRPRSGKHHLLAPLRHWLDQNQHQRQHRLHHPPAPPQPATTLRVPENDQQLAARYPEAQRGSGAENKLALTADYPKRTSANEASCQAKLRFGFEFHRERTHSVQAGRSRRVRPLRKLRSIWSPQGR
ncbi:MAG: hypothetical protein AB7V26_14295 [Lysobacterales bacterium]